MIRRLLEANYFENREHPTPQRINFWLRDSALRATFDRDCGLIPVPLCGATNRTPSAYARSLERNRAT